MLNDLTIGQYYPSNSVIHRIDPRLKIVLLLITLVFIFIAGNFVSLGIVTLFTVFIVILSGVPVSMYLKNLKIIIPILLFTMLLNLFYVSDGNILVEFWIIKITVGGVLRSVFMALRVILLIIASASLTYTTTPNDLTSAIERLLLPLKFVGLGGAVHTMSMMMTIALRFIPTLVEETQKITNAQKARGADFESGNIIQKIKAIIPILIPLLISSVRRATDLAEAMECRCYNGGKNKTSVKQYKLGFLDAVSFFVVAIICTLIILSNIFVKFVV